MLNSMGFKQMNSASEISTGSPMGLPAWTKAEFVIHPTRLIADDPDFNQELGSSRPVEVVLEYAEQYDEFPFLINFVKEHEKMKIEKKCQLPDEEFENHIHLVGTKDNESCVVSVITTPSDDKYRGLLRTPGGDETFFLATSEVSKPKPTVIAQAIVNKFVGYEKLSLVDSYNLSRMLIDYDFLLKIQRYKFGVLYVPNTPSSEEDLFEYMMGEKLDGEEEEKKVSPQFEEFMSFMGDKVELLNWSHYSGDLDKTENRTGKESFYRNFQQLEVMFQVAPLIPKIRRKPIIGNTIVTIVFLEDGFFDLSLILSQVIHVIVVVQPIKQDDGWVYRVAVARKKGVPIFSPHLPENPDFKLDDEFRDFFLTKLINAERASYRCSSKVRSQKKTLFQIMRATRKGQLEHCISSQEQKPLKVDFSRKKHYVFSRFTMSEK
mmetsp:Transcript_31440/g.49109  ORF Transcript_31440/g.49109 Transcript_31440/m.49109 type:complete len:434 (-) Transcript_31440:26-1327(-)